MVSESSVGPPANGFKGVNTYYMLCFFSLIQNQVQNMMSSKFVGFYETEVTAWAKKLGTADAVIAIWFEVQRKWQYLESIFVGSDDIRAQLPEDSRRFDTIDKNFKV